MDREVKETGVADQVAQKPMHYRLLFLLAGAGSGLLLLRVRRALAGGRDAVS